MRLSGSRLGTFFGCGWWAREDTAYDEPIRDMTHANRGADIHAHCALAIEDGLLPDDPEMRSMVLPVLELVKELEAVVIDVEAAWVWDPKTRRARKLGNNIGREYAKHGALPHEVPASFDLVLFVPAWNKLVVIDFKSGYGDVKSADENPQLLFASLCYSTHAALSRGGTQRQEIWFLRPGKVWVDGADVDVFKLGSFEASLVKRLALLPYLPAVPGEHCTYCPAAGGCPGTNDSIGKLVDTTGNTFSTSIENMGHASWMLERLPMIEKAAEAIREALKAYSDEHHGIACSDGKVWKAVPGKRSGLNMPAVKELLGEKYEQYTTTHEFMSYRKVKAK